MLTFSLGQQCIMMRPHVLFRLCPSDAIIASQVAFIF